MAMSEPRLVLFSPIAHEDLHDRNLPDGSANNKRLEMYTAAMAEVAKANGVLFVDLFHPTQELYAKAKTPLTDQRRSPERRGQPTVVAEIIDKALFGRSASQVSTRPAWRKSARPCSTRTSSGSTATARSTATTSTAADPSSNTRRWTARASPTSVVMEREMEVLDVMTANRDKRVWAVAKGSDLKVDDSNVPPFIPVPTNMPGPLPGGKFMFLDGDEAIKKMTLGKGLKINLFASEKEFPDLVNPVQMAWDTKGRLWVAVWPIYPHWKPGDPMNDKLLDLRGHQGHRQGRQNDCLRRPPQLPDGLRVLQRRRAAGPGA